MALVEDDDAFMVDMTSLQQIRQEQKLTFKVKQRILSNTIYVGD